MSFASKYIDTGKQLGKGQYGTAWLVTSQETGELLVMKRFNVKLVDFTELKYAKAEIVALHKLNHPNVVRYVDSLENPEHFSIVMEYASGGTLGRELETRKKLKLQPFPDDQVFRWGGQLLSAIDYIHEQKVMHRDIKPDNVFLSGDKDVKLGDFGVVKMTDASLKGGTLMGTPAYMALEIFQAHERHETYSAKVDEWSVGILIFELATLDRPFTAKNINDLIRVLGVRKFSVPLTALKNTEIYEVVDGLLKKDPKDRLSSRQALALSASFRQYDPLAAKKMEDKDEEIPDVKLEQISLKSTFQELQDLGSAIGGSFGKTIVMREITSGRISLVKKCQQQLLLDPLKFNKLKYEVDRMLQLSHPQLIIYKSHFEAPDGDYYVRLEFFRNRSLAVIIEKHKKQSSFITEKTALDYCAQLCLALKFLHEKGITHRDVTPSNIFMKDSSNKIKLGDLGVAKELLGAAAIVQSFPVSASYLAPELLAGPAVRVWSQKSDMFSLGCVLYEVAVLKKAFANGGKSQLSPKERSSIDADLSARNYSGSVVDLVANLLSRNPDQRKSAVDVLDVPQVHNCAAQFIN